MRAFEKLNLPLPLRRLLTSSVRPKIPPPPGPRINFL
jgi:hypothetical protein